MGSIGAFFGNRSLPQGRVFVWVRASVITSVVTQLTLGQYGFELCGSTYMWIFSSINYWKLFLSFFIAVKQSY